MISETSEASGLVRCNNIILTLNVPPFNYRSFCGKLWVCHICFCQFAGYHIFVIPDIIHMTWFAKINPALQEIPFVYWWAYPFSMDIDPINTQFCPIYSAGEIHLLLFEPYCLHDLNVHCFCWLKSFFYLLSSKLTYSHTYGNSTMNVKHFLEN